jgi:prepilin-type processing-associated H-X9-DG protein
MTRGGLGRTELLVITGIVVIGGLLLAPLLLSRTESARRARCAMNFRNLGVALRSYHSVHSSFPPAAVWHPGQLQSLMLNHNRRVDRITRVNWSILLLPYLGRDDTARLFDSSAGIGTEPNQRGRTTWLAEFTCPSDHFNHRGNPYRFELETPFPKPIEFARGNYGINLGSQCHRYAPGSVYSPDGDGADVEIDEVARTFRYTGSGIAGINRSLSLDDLVNGQSTLVAIDELRAGIDPLDPRGVWALGQIGGSMTSAHGVSGDAGSPNNAWERADDILGCGRLHAAVGTETLLREKMPCPHYIDRNDQATARSLHPGGVNTLFVDGSVRFLADSIDRGLWHVMHSRETPADVLAEGIDTLSTKPNPPPEKPAPNTTTGKTTVLPELASSAEIVNSLGMTFVPIPAGTFKMGIPDIGNSSAPPPETPAHEVRITRPFHLGKFEVRQIDFQTVMGRNPSFHHGEGHGDGTSELATANLPVEQVSWNAAAEFCRRLSEVPAEQQAGRRYRLPTEAEWEYACRSGKSAPFEWQTAYATSAETGAAGGVNPQLPIRPVGSYPPNGFGLHDMRGNVWEWCDDWFDRAYYSRSPLEDPRGPAEGYLKVLRGGDWVFVGEFCRINFPILPPWKSNRFVGFRVVCEPVR